jgi:hypothetical protein
MQASRPTLQKQRKTRISHATCGEMICMLTGTSLVSVSMFVCRLKGGKYENQTGKISLGPAGILQSLARASICAVV